MKARKPDSFDLIFTLPVGGIAFWVALVKQLRQRGFAVQVWEEVSEKRYRDATSRASRVMLQLRVWVVFPLRVIGRALLRRGGRPVLWVVPTTPAHLPALAACTIRGRRSRVLHLLYDLYPDVIALDAGAGSARVLERTLASCTRLALRRSDATVFLGERLRAHAEGKYGKARNGTVIPVGGDGDLFPDRGGASSMPVRALYSGNMGQGHGHEMLARLVSRRLPPSVELAFHASGASYRAFKQTAMRNLQAGVTLGGPLDVKEWACEMARCHIAVVTLRPGAERVMMPSKTYSAMLAGQAVIAACDRRSDLADLVVEAGCGWIVDPEDDQGVWDALADAASDARRLGELQRKAQQYARRHFDMRVVVERWSEMLGAINDDQTPDDPAHQAGQ